MSAIISDPRKDFENFMSELCMKIEDKIDGMIYEWIPDGGEHYFPYDLNENVTKTEAATLLHEASVALMEFRRRLDEPRQDYEAELANMRERIGKAEKFAGETLDENERLKKIKCDLENRLFEKEKLAQYQAGQIEVMRAILDLKIEV